jgi:hypothetical protein
LFHMFADNLLIFLLIFYLHNNGLLQYYTVNSQLNCNIL